MTGSTPSAGSRSRRSSSSSTNAERRCSSTHTSWDVAAAAHAIAIMRGGRVVWQGAVDEAPSKSPGATSRASSWKGRGRDAVLAVAANTFRETIRTASSAIILFAPAMIVASPWPASISLGQQDRMIKISAWSAAALGLIVAAFVAASLVRKEVVANGLHHFSKPVLVGRVHLGQVLACRHDVRRARGMTVSSSRRLGGGRRTLGLAAAGWLLIDLELLVVMAMTMLFSTMTSAILASVWGICATRPASSAKRAVAVPSRTYGDRSCHVAAVFYLVLNLSAVDIRAAVVGEGGVAGPASGRGASICSPTSSSRWSSPPGSSRARSSDLASLAPHRRRGAGGRVPRRRDRRPVEPAGRGQSEPGGFVRRPALQELLARRAGDAGRRAPADTTQYYGEHLRSDHRLESPPAMVRLVTR